MALRSPEAPPVTTPDNPAPSAPGEAPRVSRRERNQVFYRALSAKILTEAGVELTPVEASVAVGADTLAPHGRRQEKALETAVALSGLIKNHKQAAREFAGSRGHIRGSREAGLLNWTHVTQTYINGQKKALKAQMKAGEIDGFEYQKTVKALGHPSSPHHGFRLRNFTEQERSTPVPMGKGERQALTGYEKYVKGARAIAGGSTRKGIRRAMRLRGLKKENERHERRVAEVVKGIDWDKKFDIDKLVDLRATAESVSETEAGRLERVFQEAGLELDWSEATTEFKKAALTDMLPRYLGVSERDFINLVPGEYKQALWDVLAVKSWDELEQLQDAKAAGNPVSLVPTSANRQNPSRGSKVSLARRAGRTIGAMQRSLESGKAAGVRQAAQKGVAAAGRGIKAVARTAGAGRERGRQLKESVGNRKVRKEVNNSINWAEVLKPERLQTLREQAVAQAEITEDQLIEIRMSKKVADGEEPVLSTQELQELNLNARRRALRLLAPAHLGIERKDLKHVYRWHLNQLFNQVYNNQS